MGIYADSAAKAALQKGVSDCLISYTDADQYISQYVRDLWQSEWDTAVDNKLHATKPLIGEQLSAYRSICRDEVGLSRLKLGHSYLNAGYKTGACYTQNAIVKGSGCIPKSVYWSVKAITAR